MVDVTISLRVDKRLHDQMKLHDEVNWSASLRKLIVEQIDKIERIDVLRAERAAKEMDVIRKSKVFDKGRSSTEIIREWRQKRR